MSVAGHAPGASLARLLAGSWRPAPAPADLSPTELEALVPLLEGSGTAGLGWWRLRGATALATSAAGEALHGAYQRLAVASVIYESRLAALTELLRAQGLDPLLAKGWAAARLYPEPSCRPCGDVDLSLPRDHHATVRRLLVPGVVVDLHERFDELEGRSLATVKRRSRLLPLGSTTVRVVGPEDHLALLCIHFLRHGGWRPLWLCDVAAAIESCGPDFDWAVCFGRNRRRAGWIRCAIQLSAALLGARLDRIPERHLGEPLPRWVARQVLSEWDTPYASLPRGLLADLGRRWPNPIKATIAVRGPLNDDPSRWTAQVGEWVLRAGQLFTGVPNPH